MQAREAYGELPAMPMFGEELLARPALAAFYDRLWPRVFPEAGGGVPPESRWQPRTTAGKQPQQPAGKSVMGLLPVVTLTTTVAAAAAVWYSRSQ